jgi:natural product precursor
MKQPRYTQPTTRTNLDEQCELSTQQMNNVHGGANPRPYRGPTAVAFAWPEVCNCGCLAPYPF